MPQAEEMDLDDTRLQETGAELEIVLVVVSYFAEQRMASRNTIRLKVNADMTWEDVRKIYAKVRRLSLSLVQLVLSLLQRVSDSGSMPPRILWIG